MRPSESATSTTYGPSSGGVTATGRIVRQGARIVFAAAELVADDGTLLATASGVFTRAKAPAPMPERTEEIR